MPSNIAPVLDWIRGVDVPAVEEKWVPGATATERQRLSALAAVARLLLSNAGARDLPTEINQWIADTPEIPPEVVASLTAAMQESPDKTLADLYARIVHNSHRRVLGTFFTPPDEVALMLNMWNETQAPPKSVVDVGAGVGVFTASAARRWPDASVYAVDVNPVTLGLLAARVTQAYGDQGAPSSIAKVSIVLEDFTTWLPKTWSDLTPGRLILGNPPYTRSQLLSVEDRRRLAEAAGDLCGNRASLSTIITALSLRKIGPEDGVCLLLPAHWLEADYARPLRKHLAKLKRRRVELRLVDSRLFADAQVDAVALLVGAEQQEDQTFAVANWPDSALHVVDRSEAAETPWRRHFLKSSRIAAAGVRQRSVADSVPLSDLCIVRRGVATGANWFFLLSESQRQALTLTEQHLTPTIRRLIALPDLVTQAKFTKALSDERRWLLTVTQDKVNADADLAAYIAHGEAEGANLSELCSRREVWFDLAHDMVIPDVVVGSMTRGGFRLIENKVGAAITNNLYGWRWRDGIKQGVRAQALTWLRSEAGQEALIAVSRRPGDGLLKLEPRALRDVRLPQSVVT